MILSSVGCEDCYLRHRCSGESCLIVDQTFVVSEALKYYNPSRAVNLKYNFSDGLVDLDYADDGLIDLDYTGRESYE